MHATLEIVLILLAVAVVVAAAARALHLPPMLGYLLTGIAIGPFGVGWIPDTQETRYLAEFGVVFLMFSVGLEFSLPRLRAMQGTVFGFGGAQVGITLLLTLGLAWLLGLPIMSGFALGGVLAMSSTAIVSKLLAERMELQTPHGRMILGALLFQDLAVVPMLILVPALAMNVGAMAAELGWAVLKAVLVLGLILYAGQRIMRSWFHHVAAAKSPEIFTLNLLLFTLGLAYLTERAGLSLALGAFLAGMLVSETEYRYQVEDDIKPFRDVLLGLFFVTIGMRLDLASALQSWWQVLALLAAIMLGKGVVIWTLARSFGNAPSTAVRTALGLAQAGEFGFVLMALSADNGLLETHVWQPVLAAMVLSMVIAPLLINRMESLTRLICGSDWANQAKHVHDIAVKTFGKAGHVVLCGYGRSGQSLARLLEAEDMPFVALDYDPERVKAAASAGESVVFGDAGRREVLIAAGLSRAKALVVTFADVKAALSILRHAHEIKPELPVVVRTTDESSIDILKEAGAAEVVAEIMEGSLMMASHTLMLLGLPLSHVMRRIQAVRESRYELMRGFFRGVTDVDEGLDDTTQPRLFSVHIGPQYAAIGKSLAELDLEQLLVGVVAVRRRGIKGGDPQPETKLEAGDVIVLRGTSENLATAEMRLLQG
ncbi:MAG: monovalent cation:proton antiporter-2 (CPA2) family protein [Thiobacillaceae bacterium]